jgi:hypothetical protein
MTPTNHQARMKQVNDHGQNNWFMIPQSMLMNLWETDICIGEYLPHIKASVWI